MKNCSLGIIIKNDEILLGEKLRGFAKGVLNGIGGKKDDDETMEACMIREAKEEIGITIQEKDMKHMGILDFHFIGKSSFSYEVHIFLITTYRGKVTSSEEIAPYWFDITNIPYNKMWPADKKWLPEVLAGKFVKYKIVVKGEGAMSQVVEIIKL